MDNPISQYREFVATLARCAPDNLGSETFQYWIRHPRELSQFLSGLKREKATTTELPTYPKVGEVFELTLDPVKGLEMLKNSPREYLSDQEYWELRCQEITEPETRRFKLVSEDYKWAFNILCKALRKHGKVATAPWREALRASFRPDGHGPVGVAYDAWVDPDGDVYFPYVDTDGYSYFTWHVNCGEFDGSWRWLVQVSK